MLTMAKRKTNLSLFSQRVYERRTELGLSQEAVGLLIGISDPESAKVKISRLETVKDDIRLSLATLKQLAQALNVSVDWLLGLSPDKTGLISASDLPPDDFGALQEFRIGHIESLVERWKKRLRKSPSD